MITLQAVYTLEQTVEKPQDLSEKFALGRSRGKSDFPEGRSLEGKSDYPMDLPWANFQTTNFSKFISDFSN